MLIVAASGGIHTRVGVCWEGVLGAFSVPAAFRPRVSFSVFGLGEGSLGVEGGGGEGVRPVHRPAVMRHGAIHNRHGARGGRGAVGEGRVGRSTNVGGDRREEGRGKG